MTMYHEVISPFWLNLYFLILLFPIFYLLGYGANEMIGYEILLL